MATFDFSDLNAYLLMVVGLSKPEEGHASAFRELMSRARAGQPIAVKDIKRFSRQEEIVHLPWDSNLTEAVEIFGSGLHRIMITREGMQDVFGILTQSRLVRFFWENGRSFPQIEAVFSATLRDLKIGSRAIVSIKYVLLYVLQRDSS